MTVTCGVPSRAATRPSYRASLPNRAMAGRAAADPFPRPPRAAMILSSDPLRHRGFAAIAAAALHRPVTGPGAADVVLADGGGCSAYRWPGSPYEASGGPATARKQVIFDRPVPFRNSDKRSGYNSSARLIMSYNPREDSILTRFRAALGKIYGDRLERVVLYGSRARRSSTGFGLRYCRVHQRPRHAHRGIGQIGGADHGHSARYRRGDFGQAVSC